MALVPRKDGPISRPRSPSRQSRSKTAGQPALHVADSPVANKAPATCSRRLRRTSPHVAGDKNDRHVSPVHSDALLQFEAIESWKINVKNETAWNGLWMVEEFLCRGEGPRHASLHCGSRTPEIREPEYRRQQRTRLKLRLPCATIPTDPQTRTLHSFYSAQSTECGTLTSGEVPN